jgi:hypothetical protein
MNPRWVDARPGGYPHWARTRLEDHVLSDVRLADEDEPLPVNTERRSTDGNHPSPRGSGAGDLPAEIYPPSLPDSFLFPAQRLIGYLQ